MYNQRKDSGFHDPNLKTQQVEVIRTEGASCMEGFIARAGSLTLNHDAIVFEYKDHKQFQPVSVPLVDIDKVDYFRTLSIIPNGLSVFLRSGDMIHFIVDDRKSWQDAILKAKKAKTGV